MPQRYELNLWDYWRIIRKRRWIIVLAFLAVFLPILVYVRSKVPVYTATATVKYIQHKTTITLLTEMFTYSNADPMTTQCGVISSLSVVERVVRRLRQPLGLSPDATDEEISQVASSLIQNHISTEVVKLTDLIKIKVVHPNPKLAKDIANTVAEVYQEVNLEEKSREAQVTREFIEKQLDQITLRLRESEDALSQFRTKFEVSGTALQSYNLLQDLKKRRQDISTHPEKYLEEIPEIIQLNQEISALKDRYTSLIMKYTEKHPEVVAVREQIGQLTQQRETLLTKHREAGNPELKQLEEQISTLQKELAGYPEAEIELARLKREVELNNAIYQDLKQKLTSAEIEAKQVSDVSIISRATVPQAPVEITRVLNYFIGGLIALLIGFALAFVVEHLDTSIRTIEEVEEFLKLPVLAVIPHIEPDREKVPPTYPYLITQLAPRSAPAEAYRSLRTALQLVTERETKPSSAEAGVSRAKSWLFTSTSDKEGKTMTVLNTAITLAQAGQKTCLVDTDLRGPTLHRVLGLNREPGLTDFLLGECTYGDAFRGLTDILAGTLPSEYLLEPGGLQHFYLVPAGKRIRNPTELLGSPAMKNFIQRLQSDFKVILFDSSPVIPVTDAVILAALLEHVVLVHEIGRIARGILARTKHQLEITKGKILGVVLNNLKASEMEAGLPYYYYKQKRYYHYGQE